MLFSFRVIAPISLALVLSGCSEEFIRYSYLSGPGADFRQERVLEFAQSEDEIVAQFASIAGVNYNSINGHTNDQWKEVARAGINFADVECARYIDSIYWFNRFRVTSTNQVALVGAATAGILGVAGAAADTLTMTALSFGLAGASIDNITNSVLYQLEPSAVHTLLEESQETYLEGFNRTTYDTRQGAMAAIRGYLSLCLPASLETRVNDAVSNANLEGMRGSNEDPPANSVPIVRVVPGELSMEATAIFRSVRTGSPPNLRPVIDGLIDRLGDVPDPHGGCPGAVVARPQLRSRRSEFRRRTKPWVREQPRCRPGILGRSAEQRRILER